MHRTIRALLVLWRAVTRFTNRRLRYLYTLPPPVDYSQLQSPLFKLPAELREQIYLSVLTDSRCTPFAESPGVAYLFKAFLYCIPYGTSATLQLL